MAGLMGLLRWLRLANKPKKCTWVCCSWADVKRVVHRFSSIITVAMSQYSGTKNYYEKSALLRHP